MAAPLVSVALRCRAWTRELPRIERFAARVVGAVLTDRKAAARARGRTEIGVVFADDGFVRRLNRDHRGKDRPTNVLSFPLADSGRIADGAPLLLGDVVLAHRTVRREEIGRASCRERV